MPPSASEPDPRVASADRPLRTTAVVVTWNAADHIEASLAGLPADLDLVVVDNASTDATIEAVERVAPHARILRNATNAGFAAAVNQALRAAPPGGYVLLLNPDARIDAAGVRSLVQYCEEHADVAAASARIIDPSGATERYAGGREPSLTSVAIHELGLARVFGGRSLYHPGSFHDSQTLDWVAGTCLLVRRRAIDEVGAMDEAYFLYAEDIDWCRRFREAGWRVVVVHGVTATHERALSVGRAGPWVDAHRMGSLDHYFAQRHGLPSLCAFRALRAIGASARALLFTLGSLVRPSLRARAQQRWRDAHLALLPRRRR